MKCWEPWPGNTEVQASRKRLWAYLDAHKQLGGIDHEVLHTANNVPLNRDDIYTLIAATDDR